MSVIDFVIVIISNKDFNFTFLQEIINCYCAKEGRINPKTEDGKKGIVPNFKKSQREAKKCKMAYKKELDKIKVPKSHILIRVPLYFIY